MTNTIALLLILWAGPAVYVSSATEDPAVSERVRTLAGQLRCLVCQNQTLADSQADLAVDLRNQIAFMIKTGKTDQEIVGFFVERYGDFVLYRPPLKPATYVLWFTPFLLLLAGGGLLYHRIQQLNRKSA